jgi:hypothetical protein
MRDSHSIRSPAPPFEAPGTLIFPYYGMAPANGPTYHKNNYGVLFVTAQENLFLLNCP